jgi:tRNA(adenine34) deaminase
MTRHTEDESLMLKALREAEEAFGEDEVPVGAVIIYQGRVIGRSRNQVEKLKDPTAHAEMLAITQAAAYLGAKWLQGCSLYVTLEPCTMCAGALVLARIDEVIFGAPDPKTGAFGSKTNIAKLKLNHHIKVRKGVLGEECGRLISDFFRKKRSEKKEGIASSLHTRGGEKKFEADTPGVWA